MGFIQQKRRVERLSALANARTQEMHGLQRQMKHWVTSRLGTLEALAWSFAGGAWLAAPIVTSFKVIFEQFPPLGFLGVLLGNTTCHAKAAKPK